MFEKIGGYINKYKIVAIIIIGCILRLAFIGRIPGNYNYFQDEAFSAYEAYSMVNFGMDSHGYHNPVYLETWGSGMSAVQCYCQMFWIKLLGFGPVAVRLPQAILGCITLIFLYMLMKEIADEKIAFWITFIFAISPWHITMSRWGLDCNYYIGFITIAMYLIVTSRNVLWKTILAAVFTGIALYSYASPWVVMPILIYGTIIYLFVKKEINVKSIIIFTAVLAVVAFPLFLFIAVNMGFISEIRSDFISIPKLSFFRSNDVKPSLANVGRMLSFFWTQYDYISYDSVPKYGTYFLFSNGFLIIGFVRAIVKRSKKAVIMWLWLACGVIMGVTIEANFERLNILFIPLFYFIGVGVVFVIDLFKNYKNIGIVAMCLLYGVSGLSFAKFYFTDYNEMIERVWPEGAEEAITFAQQYTGTVHISDIRHPLVLCYSKYPVEKYVETVIYEDNNAKFLQPVSFEGYDFRDYSNTNPVSGDVYICSVENTELVEWIAGGDMACAQFGQFYVAVAN